MRFRPCIDLHDGQVKQIVGATLSGLSGQPPRTNFVASQPPEYYADLYWRDGLSGGHVIRLGGGNDDAARAALRAHPGFMQLGGGIDDRTAAEWLDCGAQKVIVTSFLFPDGEFSAARLRQLGRAVPAEKLVIDLSCRRGGSGGYFVACDRWQRLTTMKMDAPSLSMLSEYCSEFLIHAVSVEGLQQGIDRDLIALLSEIAPVPVTYAGGIHSMADIALIGELGCGRIDFTVGSALDIFGGRLLKYRDLCKYNQEWAFR